MNGGPNGITDFGVKVGVKAEAGPVEALNPAETSAEIGAEARFGWNSGPSLQGQGILSKLSIK